MRFIVRYKYGILQTKTERIDINFCENTTQIIQYLQKKLSQNSRTFIAKFKRGKNHLRIIPGWKLEDYGLKEGSEIHIEMVESQEIQESKKIAFIGNKYISNILGMERGFPDKMEPVIENVNEQQQKNSSFSVRKYLDGECQRMLKEIQRKSLMGFRNIFQQIPDDVPEQYLIEIKQKKIDLIDELGERGWGALHTAIFCQADKILDELLSLDADINKCTSDGWLPIQLAIDIKSRQIIQKLLQDPNLNLNLVTSRGAPIHTAARLGQKDILMIILQKEIDVHVKDGNGKTAYQVCLDEECRNLLKKYEEKRESYNEYIRGNLPLSLTTIFRGSVMKAKRPFMNLKDRYLLVDPFQGSMIRYQTKQDYPKKAKQITPLSVVKGIKIVAQQEKSWHMKKQLVYFMIEQPNKQIYACKFRHTAQKWVSNLTLAVKFAQQLQKNPHLISQIKRHEIQIQDEQFDSTQKKQPKKHKTLFAKSILSRQSTISNRSYENRQNNDKTEETLQSNNENNHKSDITPVPQQNQTESEQKNVKNINPNKFQEEFNSIATTKVNFASFDVIKTLGSGAFGKVFLVKHIQSGKQYALKALKKKNLIVQKQLKYAIIQANILKQANNPFIINLHYAFQTPHYLYLALDYCPGRDLSFHLARQVTFPEDQARFYIAELLLAIEHLHEKKIIYRDLKPENILLDGNGHLKLADFGLSKQVGNDDKTKSFCGSPAYLSPEMLSQKGVGKQSDLYGIGTVLYEFLIGEPPYFSEDIPTLYRNIKQGKLKFPKNISENAKSLALGLLERDPKKRLGYKGTQQIKQHPFFSTINWEKLAKLELKPPLRPQLDDSQDEQDELDIITNKVLGELFRMRINLRTSIMMTRPRRSTDWPISASQEANDCEYRAQYIVLRDEKIINYQDVFKGLLHRMQARYGILNAGEGAYSTVFKVIRQSDKQVYAMKKVKLANLSDKEIENALNEVRILASIKNNNIVAYKQVFLEGKNLCIIMQFLDDGDLYQKIVEQKKKKQLFEQKEIWNVLIQILHGLKSLHTLNILHRDLKSANVFLSKEGFAKLGDLNVSKVAKNGLLYTQTGTPYYASPQVWKDAPYDMKSDIWSLGCVIYEMTTLMPPFQAEDMEGLFQSVTAGIYEPIDNRYSKQLAHIIKLMLQIKPKSRPSTQKILKSSLIQKKVEQLSLQVGKSQEIKEQLMRTIRIPKNLHYLTDKLPKSNYGNESQNYSNYTMGNSPSRPRQKRNTTGNKSISKGSLPKLSQILKSGNPSLLQKKRKYKVGDALMIQGKSKIIQQARSQQKSSKHLQKQIRDELKRIYKVRGAQSNENLPRKRSERSMLLPPIKL